MEIAECIQLIKSGFPRPITNSIWADLGCGRGSFTQALASLLGSESKIFAVDRVQQRIESMTREVEIEFVKADFINDALPISNLDGVLMANSLHYVKDKQTFILRLKKLLKLNGQLLVIEYETEKANQWVPYPIRYNQLIQLLSESGFLTFEKLGERPSIYRAEKMYACLAKGH